MFLLEESLRIILDLQRISINPCPAFSHCYLALIQHWDITMNPAPWLPLVPLILLSLSQDPITAFRLTLVSLACLVWGSFSSRRIL